jgi:hypothetical protein
MLDVPFSEPTPVSEHPAVKTALAKVEELGALTEIRPALGLACSFEQIVW